jgi:tetratricopeptide (TPR) repeat protein
VAAVVIAFALAFGAMRGQAHADAREIKAREDFAAGHFQEALDIFARLYAETLHPNYLRNIGRCYQNLGNPERAIATFRDYLRKAKGLSADEQNEIEGYIKEMEDLKKQREAAAAPAVPAATSAPVTPLPSASSSTAPAPTSSQTQAVLVGAPAATAAPAESSPIYTKWWFWTLVGAVAAGAAVGIAAATGAFNKTENATCPSGWMCPQ